MLELEEFQPLEYFETLPNGNISVNIKTNIIYCCWTGRRNANGSNKIIDKTSEI